MNGNSWQEWGKYVLKNIEEILEKLDKVEDKLSNLNVDFKVFKREMKIKIKAMSIFWGILGGVIPVIGLILIRLLK